MTPLPSAEPARAFIAYSRKLAKGNNQTITAWLEPALASEITLKQLEALQREYTCGLQVHRGPSDSGIRIIRPVIAKDVETLQKACNLLAQHMCKYLRVHSSIHKLNAPEEVEKLGR